MHPGRWRELKESSVNVGSGSGVRRKASLFVIVNRLNALGQSPVGLFWPVILDRLPTEVYLAKVFIRSLKILG
jgi:hypothetical protein